MPKVTPTKHGRDLDSKDKKHDAHIRLERFPRERKAAIFIDVFDSSIKDATKAHVESEFFPLTKRGAADASDFLLGYGFDATVILPK
ncbi:MAG TPA: hypothetical protein VJ021_00285 [Thermoplasmata archaeon]|nr:hypothetical protein [Thermoplasmata archaeon]